MKNKKSKIIAFVLVFVLLITAVVVTSVANAKTVDIQLESDKTELLAGESATISVKVTTNFSVATMSIPVFYDKTLVDVSEETTTLKGYVVAETTTDAQSVDSGKIFANTSIDQEKFGFILVSYIGSAGQELADSVDSVVLTFKITAKEKVSGNEVIKVIEESAKVDDNVAGMLYFGYSDKVLDSVPENVTNIEVTNAFASVKIGGTVEQPTLVVKSSDEFEYAEYVVIDTNNTNNGEFAGIIYGIDTLDQNPDGNALTDLKGALTSTNGDEYVIVEANESGVESTDAMIYVYSANPDEDPDAEILATYVFVYFGDVDGNGEITINDAFIMEYYEAMWEGLDFQYDIAANAQNNTYDWIY